MYTYVNIGSTDCKKDPFLGFSHVCGFCFCFCFVLFMHVSEWLLGLGLRYDDKGTVSGENLKQ